MSGRFNQRRNPGFKQDLNLGQKILPEGSEVGPDPAGGSGVRGQGSEGLETDKKSDGLMDI